jgi:hypothetical protein
MEMMPLDRAASLLWPDTPNSRLAAIAGRPKSTARSWRSARRRAPAQVLSMIRTELQSRGSAIFSLLREVDIELARREGEPPRRRGFFTVDPLTGQNRHNRIGRGSARSEQLIEASRRRRSERKV